MAVKPVDPRAGAPELPPGGSGDVIGPGSAVADSLTLFSGITGKLIKDGPTVGSAIGEIPQLIDTGGASSFPAIDGSLLTSIFNPSNIKVINSESDLPATVTGLDPDDAGRSLHPLDSFTSYFFNLGSSGITIADGLHLPGNNLVSSFNLESGALTYSGTEKMFVVSGTSQINDITMVCATGTHIDCRGAGVFLGMNNVRITACLNMGYLDCGFWVVRGGGYLNVTGTGYTHAGTNWIRCAASNWVEVINAATSGHDLGTTTPSFFLWNNCDLITVNASAFNFSGLAASGNIPVGGKGGFSDIRFSGAGAPFQNIDHGDIRWTMSRCVGTQNSTIVGGISLRNNTTDTVITTQGSSGDELGWVFVEGTYATSATNELFTMPTNGVLEYVGEEPIEIDLRAHISVQRASGNGGQLMEVTIFRNPEGTGSYDLVDSDIVGCVEMDATARTVAAEARVTALPGDLYQLRVRNLSGTVNMDIPCAQLIITGLM